MSSFEIHFRNLTLCLKCLIKVRWEFSVDDRGLLKSFCCRLNAVSCWGCRCDEIFPSLSIFGARTENAKLLQSQRLFMKKYVVGCRPPSVRCAVGLSFEQFMSAPAMWRQSPDAILPSQQLWRNSRVLCCYFPLHLKSHKKLYFQLWISQFPQISIHMEVFISLSCFAVSLIALVIVLLLLDSAFSPSFWGLVHLMSATPG